MLFKKDHNYQHSTYDNQPCQNVQGASNFATYSKLFPTNFTWEIL